MSVQSSNPKRKTSSKKSPSAKKTPLKKGKSARKSKKPKVTLAKTKVATLCGLICGICVLAIGLSVISNGEQGTGNREQREIENGKLKTENVLGRDVIARNNESAKSHNDEAKKSQNTEVKKQEEGIRNKEQGTGKKEEQSTKSRDNEKKTESQKTDKKSESSPNVKVVTKEMKENSSVVKTIPQSQTSQAGAMTGKNAQNASASAKPETKSTIASPAQNSQKTAQSSLTSQNTAKSSANSQLASAKTPRESETIQQNVPRNRFDIPPASNGATIVIIIDDAGRSVENTKRYANLPFPITIAVLPKLPQSRACADAIRAAGKEVILHQPMQSQNHALDPGPGKITTEMTTYEIARIVKENLAELGPGVRGLNNHEGSDVTSNEIKIGAVLDVCDEMGVYFLDSRTTAATKAPQAALERDMHIFEKAGPYLDNDIDRAKMLERMRETLAYANRHGRAIVIGHVDKSVKILPDLLAEMYPEMKAAGYRFATPSQLR